MVNEVTSEARGREKEWVGTSRLYQLSSSYVSESDMKGKQEIVNESGGRVFGLHSILLSSFLFLLFLLSLFAIFLINFYLDFYHVIPYIHSSDER